MPGDAQRRRELAEFLRSRRSRIDPRDLGLPVGPRRRSAGLRREEVAVLAGLSPTWYTYLEQGRKIQPSPQVLDSLAQVLRLSEDERRYLHALVHGEAISAQALEPEASAGDLLRRIVATTEPSPYPVYAADRYGDLIAWNRQALEWYDDWDALRPGERNILRWMLTAPAARERLVDWESDTRDAVARWRAEAAKWPLDAGFRERIEKLSGISPEFATWWSDQNVQEHRSKIRRLRHPELGVRVMLIVPMTSPEFTPSGVVFHLPVNESDAPKSA
ncbi:helix-turn-helix domain-containing protein [Actinomadura barringtoniae]|uniref:Helix-turn-helix domain-containing protein n=1 Tax=Actinomadura barringtoniae TaxID=1427535 RepID=A0A939PAC8_9ACTN|nr:helix-turn-helix transcriptional regulator [Actinomadura barringtoniae]MBO2448768.1 helix-turn-helix domain-containing protein [Actinomadura barringtoniae]